MNVALILSGGTGTRLGGDIPKQYIEVGGRPIITYCMERLSAHDGIDAIQIVAEPSWQEQIKKWMCRLERKPELYGFSAPGETRQISILRGINDICKYAQQTDRVLIHDAARPLLTDWQITDCLRAADGHDGVLPVLPMKDTVYASTDGTRVTTLLNRDELYAGQAPEVFVLDKYRKANERLVHWVEKNSGDKLEIAPDSHILKINGSAEPAIMADMDIVMIPGDEGNFKITTRADLERFEAIVSRRAMK